MCIQALSLKKYIKDTPSYNIVSGRAGSYGEKLIGFAVVLSVRCVNNHSVLFAGSVVSI